jgi:hypothetical protein
MKEAQMQYFEEYLTTSNNAEVLQAIVTDYVLLNSSMDYLN